jgi:very-short-patch-repair endonuclease
MRRVVPSSSARQQLLAARAAGMREFGSEPELRLWRALRASQLGVRFRRQVVIGSAIVDFIAPSARLVVEVDGATHARTRGHDARRDRALVRLGYRVLRIEAQLVLGDLGGAVALIREALQR